MEVWAPTGLDGGPFKSGHTRCITKAHHFNTEASLFTLNVPGRSNCLQVHQPAAPCCPCWLWAFEKPPTPTPPQTQTLTFMLCITMRSTDWGKKESCTHSVWILPCCSYSAANLISAFFFTIVSGLPIISGTITPSTELVLKRDSNQVEIEPLLIYKSHPFVSINNSFRGRTVEILASMRMALRRLWGPAHSVGIWTFL